MSQGVLDNPSCGQAFLVGTGGGWVSGITSAFMMNHNRCFGTGQHKQSCKAWIHLELKRQSFAWREVLLVLQDTK